MNISKKDILKIKNSDHETFRIFYINTIDLFFRWIKSHYNIPNIDIQDILSDFYVKIRENRKKIPEDNYNNRLRIVFKNNLKDWFKKKKLTNFSSLINDNNSFEEKLPDTDENIIDILEKNYKLEKIKKAIKKLDELSQDLIFLKFIENKSYKEISTILGYNEEMIRQRISRAIKKLKKILDNT